MKVLLHQPLGIAHGERYLAIHRESLERAGVEVLIDGRNWEAGLAQDLIDRAARERVQILHLLTVDGGRSELLRLLARWGLSPPAVNIVATLHNFPRLAHPLGSILMRLLLARGIIRALLVPCGDRERLPGSWRADSKVVPVFEPLELARDALKARKRSPRVLFAGIVTEEKGVLDFVRLTAGPLGRAGLTGLIAGECVSESLQQHLSEAAHASRGGLQLKLERLSENELNMLIASSEFVWCAYQHERGSGIGYRSFEQLTPILTWANSVPGLMCRLFDAGVVLDRSDAPDAVERQLSLGRNRYPELVEGCRKACLALDNERYGRLLMDTYQTSSRP